MSSETTSARSRPLGELEAAILETLEAYFEAYLQEAHQRSKGRVAAGFGKYEQAHEQAHEQAGQQLAKAETKLEQIRQRTTEEIRAEALNSVLEGDGACDLDKEVFVSCRHREVRELAEVEKAVPREERKE